MVKRLHRIGVDIMGSDLPPLDLLQTLEALGKEFSSEVRLIAIGTSPFHRSSSHYDYVVAKESIEMEDLPLQALREKKHSSLHAGMQLLKKKSIDAFVSAGNTGALISCAKVYLSTLPNILRPSLLALIPTKKAPLAVLDVGATIATQGKHLVQFAHMGTAFQKSRGISSPKVGLLNIGSEAQKGTSAHREAYQILQSENLNFLGNIEGKEVFEGEVDVLVTDGFTGNVFLKTAEGIANLVLDRLQENIDPKELNKQWTDLKKHLHYAEYPGALVCGVNGIVVKCHGYSSTQAVASGIKGALRMVKEDLLLSLKNQLR